jgi:transcription antitermination factor NusG
MPDIAHTSDSYREQISTVITDRREDPAWYAIRVRPRSEKLVAAALRSKQYEEFVPLYQKRSRWSDRIKSIDLPLFPGYVFCRADFAGRPPVVTTPSVIGILSFGGRPALISEQEIHAIRIALRSGLKSEPCPYLREGDRVRIVQGPLVGIEGVLSRLKNDWRVVLSIDVLCRSVAVEIDRAWATPLASANISRWPADLPRLSSQTLG